MATVEERLATLEADFKGIDSKIGTLFSKIDALVTKIDALTSALTKLEIGHQTCIRNRNETTGWFKTRGTKIADSFISGAILIVLYLLLKNASVLLPLIGGGK